MENQEKEINVELTLKITYEEDFKELNISTYNYYNSCSYDIKNLNEIGQCVNDYIKNYIKK